MPRKKLDPNTPAPVKTYMVMSTKDGKVFAPFVTTSLDDAALDITKRQDAGHTEVTLWEQKTFRVTTKLAFGS